MNPILVGDVLSGLTLTFVMLDGAKVNHKYKITYQNRFKLHVLFAYIVMLWREG